MRDIGGSLDECVSPPLDSDGVPLSRTSTAAAEGGSDSSELESVSVPPRRRALGLIAQLGGLLGANDGAMPQHCLIYYLHWHGVYREDVGGISCL